MHVAMRMRRDDYMRRSISCQMMENDGNGSEDVETGHSNTGTAWPPELSLSQWRSEQSKVQSCLHCLVVAFLENSGYGKIMQQYFVSICEMELGSGPRYVQKGSCTYLSDACVCLL